MLKPFRQSNSGNDSANVYATRGLPDKKLHNPTEMETDDGSKSIKDKSFERERERDEKK